MKELDIFLAELTQREKEIKEGTEKVSNPKRALYVIASIRESITWIANSSKDPKSFSIVLNDYIARYRKDYRL